MQALFLRSQGLPIREKDLAQLGGGGGAGRLPQHSQLLAPSERLMEKASVAMRKIFHWSIPVPHKKNLPHIRHIFQCNYPQPTHTAWRIKT